MDQGSSLPFGLRNTSNWLAFAARLSFAATVILIPVRFHTVLLARPTLRIYDEYTDFSLFAADVAMLLTLALWLLSLSFSRRRVALGPRHIWIPLAGLTLAGWISAVSSYDPILSIYHAIRLSALFWFYIYLVNEIGSTGWILIPVGIEVSIQSVVAIAQFIAQRSVNLQSVGELYLDPARSGVSVVVANGVRLLRAYGLSDHPNILGGCLAFGALLLLAAYLQNPKHPAILAAFLPAAAGLLVTFSRSAWLGFAAGAILILAMTLIQHRWESLKPMLWLALMTAILLSTYLLAYARFFGVRLNAGNSFNTPSVEQQSIGERLLLVNYAAPLLSEHPFFGIGLGTSPLALQARYPEFPVAYQPVHLTLFDAALETGLLGAVCYLVLMISPFVIYFRHRESLLVNPVATAALALLLAVDVIGFLDYYAWLLVPGRLLQWLTWGLWAAALIQNTSHSLSHQDTAY